MWQKIFSYLTQHKPCLQCLQLAPVHFQAEVHAVFVFALQDALTPEEENQLKLLLQPFFQEKGLSLETQAQPWRVQLPQALSLTTTSLEEAAGKNLAEVLPVGENQGYWRQLLTEVQMLLHAQPFNRLRQARGKATINGIWLW